MRLRALYSLGRHAGEKKKNGTASAIGKCRAFLGFKELVMEESTGSKARA